jgi:hypothetical protein
MSRDFASIAMDYYNNVSQNAMAAAKHACKELGEPYSDKYRLRVRHYAKKGDKGIASAAESLEVSVTNVPYLWLKTKEASLFVRNPNYKVSSIDFDAIISECMAGFKPVKKVKAPKTKLFDRLVWTDVHVGMDASRKGLALYDAEWNAVELMKRVDIMADFVIDNKTSNTLIIDELGDYLDGWDGETTRKGHHLPQNMTNEEAFDNGLRAKLYMIEKLSPHFEYITCNNICEDNHCFDDQTQVLTDNGWKNYVEVTDTDSIATLNMNTDEVEFQFPIRRIYNPINRVIKMHHYKSKINDICVTDQHKMLLKRDKFDKSKETYNYQLSSDIDKRGCVKFRSAGSIKSKELENISDDIIKLCAWILTDGSIVMKNNFRIYQSKENGILEIESILSNLNISYNKTVKKPADGDVYIKGVKVKSTPKEMMVYSFNKNHTDIETLETISSLISKKEIPSWVGTLSNRQFLLFLNAYISGDGSQRESTSATIHGTESMLSGLQSACSIHGVRSIMSENNRGDYTLSVVFDRNFSSFQMKDFKEVDMHVNYTWCFTMPNSNMITRRNGKVSIQGNSGSFGYILNSAFKSIVDCKFPNVIVINHKKFINFYIIGDHGFIISHGKDSRNLKFGFKPQLDPRSTEKISQYIRHNSELRACKYIEFSKGDSHQCLFDMCTSDEFDYFNFPAFSPSSEWIQTNFKKGRSGFVLQNIDMYSDRKHLKTYFFN